MHDVSQPWHDTILEHAPQGLACVELSVNIQAQAGESRFTDGKQGTHVACRSEHVPCAAMRFILAREKSVILLLCPDTHQAGCARGNA